MKQSTHSLSLFLSFLLVALIGVSAEASKRKRTVTRSSETRNAIPLDAASCNLPGVTVLTDASGDSLDSTASHDVQSASVAEPASIGAGKIAFVLKMANLS